MTLLTRAAQAKAEIAAISAQIERFGREIDDIRYPEGGKQRERHSLTDQHRLTGWHQTEVKAGQGWWDDEDIYFEEGTRVVTLTYYHRRWEDEVSITFPVDYFDDLDTAKERERASLVEREALQAAREKEQREEQERAAEISRREMYERLKAEFGDQP